MQIKVADIFNIEFPGIPEPIPESKSRFYTIQDFDTQEEFNAYIIEFCKAHLFNPVIADANSKRKTYHRASMWEIKLYDHAGKIGLKFKVPSKDFYVKDKVYFSPYTVSEETREKQRQKELEDMPMDIFLALIGFVKVVVAYEGFTRIFISYHAQSKHQIVIAWLLGISRFRDFFNNNFTEDYIKIFTKIGQLESIVKLQSEKALEKYQEIYGVGKVWKITE